MTRVQDTPPLTLALALATGLGMFVLATVLLPAWITVPSEELHLINPAIPLLAFARSDPRSLSDYASIVDRPLFNPGRRKDAPLPTATAAPLMPALSSYRLVGLMISKDARLALVERRTAHQIVTLHAGDQLDGRHVEDIKGTGVYLSGPSGNEWLTIPKANGDPWPVRTLAPSPQKAGSP
jgi:hypothetical protein